MPRSPQWFQHLPAALEQLAEFPAPVIDRATLEKLLEVSRRDAIRLLHRFGGYQAGRTFLIGREQLVNALKAVIRDQHYTVESYRRQRLSSNLKDTRHDLRARQVRLPVAPDSQPSGSLPLRIRVARPGVLEVEFASAEDLLARLYELVQIAGQDFDSFKILMQTATDA